MNIVSILVAMKENPGNLELLIWIGINCQFDSSSFKTEGKDRIWLLLTSNCLNCDIDDAVSVGI